MMKKLGDLLSNIKIIPVIKINNENDALPLAEALLQGGLSSLEITLRTSVAITAIKKIKLAFPEIIIGAGTVLSSEQYYSAVDAGCEFVVSPGYSHLLHEIMIKTDVPYLPGVATLTEMMQLREKGYQWLKFFPAELNGGAEFLQTVYSVLPDLQFCPTGGVQLGTARDYLDLPNVPFIGGTWMIDQSLIQQQNFAAITALAKQASSI